MRFILLSVCLLFAVSGCASTRTSLSVSYNQYVDPQTTLRAEYRIEQNYAHR